MNIILYCQYVWGMGHLVRSLELARALSEHDVTLVAGGQEVAVNLPDHVNFVRLPALYMDEMFTTLIAGESGRTVEQIKQDRPRDRNGPPALHAGRQLHGAREYYPRRRAGAPGHR